MRTTHRYLQVELVNGLEDCHGFVRVVPPEALGGPLFVAAAAVPLRATGGPLMDVSKLCFALIEAQHAMHDHKDAPAHCYICSNCAVNLQERLCPAMLKCRAYTVGPGARKRMPHCAPEQAKRRRFVPLCCYHSSSCDYCDGRAVGRAHGVGHRAVSTKCALWETFEFGPCPVLSPRTGGSRCRAGAPRNCSVSHPISQMTRLLIPTTTTTTKFPDGQDCT
jgi:hypothetical protein